ncbi:MAG: DUF1476 domain-containing protein [Paracoccaceae bacterium]|nr:DUF1476 domain-containing protein [Paracoccaceae bacterium]MDE2914996.1 DUF1476 domain-containing protein [Paracoccaceae bacterium]
MKTFEERKKGFESKYAHDAALRFKVEARRNKLLGLWAADQLGKSGDEATRYVGDVIKSDFDEPGDEDVFRKVAGDLGELVGGDEVRRKMDEFLEVAEAEILEQE